MIDTGAYEAVEFEGISLCVGDYCAGVCISDGNRVTAQVTHIAWWTTILLGLTYFLPVNGLRGYLAGHIVQRGVTLQGVKHGE